VTMQRNLRRWSIAATSLLFGAGLVTRIACTPTHGPGARAPGAPDSAAESPDMRSGGAEPARSAAAPSSQPAPSKDTPFGAPGSTSPFTTSTAAPEAHTAVVDALGNGALPSMDRQELRLLANIERELKLEPPPAVRALLAEYRRGADRAILVSRVQRDFPNDLPLRVTVLRWIDEVRPEANQTRAAPVPGQGTQSKWLRPLEKHR
jgi:hypothetical protein